MPAITLIQQHGPGKQESYISETELHWQIWKHGPKVLTEAKAPTHRNLAIRYSNPEPMKVSILTHQAQASRLCASLSRGFSRGTLSPQGIGGDGHNALRALFRGEARGKFQGLIRQGSEMETRLVRIAQPRAAWHGQHLRKEKHLR